MILPYFGELDPTLLNEHYEVKTTFDGNQIQIDLHLTDPAQLDIIKTFLENLERINEENKAEMSKDYNSGDSVQYFMEEVIGGFELVKDAPPREGPIDPVELLFNIMYLVKLTLYPDREDHFAVFNYIIATGIEGVQDFPVVIKSDRNGEPEFMGMER